MNNYLYDIYNRFKGSGNSKRTIREGEYISNFDNNFNGRKITQKDIEDILQMADCGEPYDQVGLFNCILDREPMISSHIQTRKLAVTGSEWQIVNEKNDPDDKAIADFQAYGIEDCISHLMEGFSYGYSGVINKWLTGGKLDSFEEIHPANVVFDLAGNPALKTIENQQVPFGDYIDGQFILHKHNIRTGLPTQQSLLRCLVFLYLYKYYGIQHQARFLEKFGSPFLTAKLSKALFNDKEVYAKTMASLKNAGFSGSAIIPEGAELNTMAINTTGGTQAFQLWFNYIDDVYATVILGQIATKGEAGGLSKGQAQENVRMDIYDADCKAIAKTINKQLLRPYQIFKYGKDIGLKFKIGWEEPEDLDKKADTVVKLSSAGFKPKKEWVEETFNIPIAETEQATEQVTEQAGQQMSFSEQDAYLAKQEFITSLTDRTLTGLFKDREVINRLYKPLTETIREVFKGIDTDADNILEVFEEKITELFVKFPALYDQMDVSGLQDALQKAILISMARGYNKGV